MNIIFLHHSTGKIIWDGGRIPLMKKIAWKMGNNKLAEKIETKAKLPELFHKYNNANNTNYSIVEQSYPEADGTVWNFPHDYYEIWIKNAGEEPYRGDPTLEILAKDYQVIIFKHCFPVSNISADQDSADIDSDIRTLSNYKLQYAALQQKLHEFSNIKFILFTGAVQTKANISEDEAKRAKEFFDWVKTEWDLPDDNIFLWDLYSLQTEGGLYFKDEYASSPQDSHPNGAFGNMCSDLLFNRIIDVIEHDGNGTLLTGEKK